MQIADWAIEYETISNEIVSCLASIYQHLGKTDNIKIQSTSSNGFFLHDVLSRTQAIIGMARSVSKFNNERLIITPYSRIQGVRDSLRGIADGLAHLKDQFSSIPDWGGISSSDQHFIFTANGNTLPIRSILDSVWQNQDSFIENFAVMSSTTAPRGIAKFAEASRQVSEIAEEAEKLTHQIAKNLANASQSVNEIETLQTSSLIKLEELDQIIKSIELKRTYIDEQNSKVQAAVATVEDTRAKSIALDEIINSLRPKLDKFELRIDNAQALQSEATQALMTTNSDLDKKRIELDQITKDARDILGQATIAGLSQEYANQAKNIDQQLMWARYSFYFSIFLLIISVTASLGAFPEWISFNLKPVPDWKVGTPVTAFGFQLIGSLASRLMIIVPSALLAKFSSARHSDLFRLREEYNHKKGLAASIDGFKAQAPEFSGSMAAAVFKELTKNPIEAGQMSKRDSDNDVIEKYIKPNVEEALARLGRTPGG